MSSARYIFRLDDIAPGMNWDNFAKIEQIFDRYNIKPIIWVVPDNQDPNLNGYGQIDDFWWKIKSLQVKWRIIAQHGYQHRYVTKDSGIVGINKYSEFAWLNYATQYDKLKAWKEILEKELHTTIKRRMAPAHSFDHTTITALKALWFEYITDGIAIRPYTKYGMKWLPQQIWKPQKKLFGVRTICLHINNYTDDFIDNIDKFCQNYHNHCTTSAESLHYRTNIIQNAANRCYSIRFRIEQRLYMTLIKIKNILTFPYRKSKELQWYWWFLSFCKWCIVYIRHFFLREKYKFERRHILPIERRPYAIYIYRYINNHTTWWKIIEIWCWLGEILNKTQSWNKIWYDIYQEVIDWAKSINKHIQYHVWSFNDIKNQNIEYLITVNFIHAIDPNTLKKYYETITHNNTIQYIVVDEVRSNKYQYNHIFSNILPKNYHLKDKSEIFHAQRTILIFEKTAWKI